jgi:uncharacterized membrane-anchored protein
MKPLSDNKNEPQSSSNTNTTLNNSNSVRLERQTSFAQFYGQRPLTSTGDYMMVKKQLLQQQQLHKEQLEQNKEAFFNNYDFVKNRNNLINNEEIADLFEKLKKRIRVNRSQSSQDHATYHKSILKNKKILNDSDIDIKKIRIYEELDQKTSPSVLSGETTSILDKNKHEFKKIYNSDKMLLVRPNLISELNARIKSATNKYNINLNNLHSNIAKNKNNNTESSFKNYSDFNDSSILKSFQSQSMPSSTSTSMYQTDETNIIYKLSKKHSKSRKATIF